MKLPSLLLIILLLIGCYRPGGGGTVHLPPDGILSNQPTELKITFSVWGAGSGRLDHRYTDVSCVYRVNESGDYHRLSGVVIRADDKHMEMKFTIPPLDLKTGDKLGYQFEMLFDGHKNSRAGGTLKIIETKTSNHTLHTNGSPGGSFKSAAIVSPAQSRMLLAQPPRLRLAPLCCHPPVSESRG